MVKRNSRFMLANWFRLRGRSHKRWLDYWKQPTTKVSLRFLPPSIILASPVVLSLLPTASYGILVSVAIDHTAL